MLEWSAASWVGDGQGHGRVTALQLDVAAVGKGFQRRTSRTEIRGTAGSVAWRAIPEMPVTKELPLQAAL